MASINALSSACYNGDLDMVRVLFEQGLTIEDAKSKDNDVLRAACSNGHLSVVQLLIDYAGYFRDEVELYLSKEQCDNLIYPEEIMVKPAI